MKRVHPLRAVHRQTQISRVIVLPYTPLELAAAQVMSVDPDAQTCTVKFDEACGNGNGSGAESEKTVALTSVRQRYQTGHIPAIDSGFEALGRFITKCCSGVSCFFVSSSKHGGKAHGPKAVTGEEL